MAGKLLFPAFPQTRLLPWALGGVATAVLITGIVTGDEPTLTVGIVGLGACVVAWPLSRLLLGSEAEPDRPEESDHLDS